VLGAVIHSTCVRPAIPRIPELTAPHSLIAVAVLALNDHVLKAAYPGLVTGKLSDVAGCFVLPLFVSAVLAIATSWPARIRLGAGVAMTFVLFAAIKLSPIAAAGVADILEGLWTLVGRRSGRLVADPTDLVALPLALAAYAHGVRVQRTVEVQPG
jgi:hypothetical protein